MSNSISKKRENKKILKEEKAILKIKKEEVDLRLRNAKALELENKLKKATEKETLEAINENGIYGTKGEPRKTFQTYLRNQNRFEVRAISILDRKAAILIRISTSVITALIIFHQYIDENVAGGHLLSHFLLSGLMITLVLSILATKPYSSFSKKIHKNEIRPLHPGLEENNFIFDGKASLEEYEASMSKVVNSQDLQIGNHVRANYIVAKNNRYKALLLDAAYITFLASFLICGIIFSFSRFHH